MGEISEMIIRNFDEIKERHGEEQARWARLQWLDNGDLLAFLPNGCEVRTER